ncbi:YciI family protein [Herbaspirillum lusitanum]|uniref:YciI family protein n=1 Tax=Herbaspirillum lusitanum TaxID=213312 RepID=UPI00037422D7|nr:YciI family protein [Herbaspirillum lusitanum]
MPKFLVLTFRTPNFQPNIVDDHYRFLDGLHAKGQLELAGPFADKSGGAYLLQVGSIDEARQIAMQDPVHTSQSSVVTVHEWNAK